MRIGREDCRCLEDFGDTYVTVGGSIAAIMDLIWRLLRMQRSM